MKTTVKKIVSLILVCIMLLSVVPMTFATAKAEENIIVHGKGETYDHYPQVMVKGFGASSVKIYYEDDPEQKSLFYPIDEERLKGNLDNINAFPFGSSACSCHHLTSRHKHLLVTAISFV